jgi:dethiobiotin synthetase
VIRVGITGTDTGVGKTLVARALSAALRRRGLRVVAMKPVETGVAFDDPVRDGAQLARAAGETRPLSVVAPLTFAQPIAPLAAARQSGSAIDVATLDRAVRDASADADALIVEGAGGLLVPVANGIAFDALFARWSLDLVIVAANRLGVDNHTRLTIAAARAAGLAVRCVVLHRLTRDPPDASVAGNAQLITELEHVAVVELPWLPTPNDLESAATSAEECGLIALLLSF